MLSTPSKRKLPRRKLPWINNLIDRFSFSKLPTNGVVLQRLTFELEQKLGKPTLRDATVTVKDELVELWSYAGYGDVLHSGSNILRMIRSLHDSYKSIIKVSHSRRETISFKTKEAAFLASNEKLFDIVPRSLKTSSLIAPEDQDFLLHHWMKTISSTRDITTKLLVEKKLERKEKYRKYSSAQPDLPSPSCNLAESSTDNPSPDVSSAEEFTPKRPCLPRPSGTTVEVSKDFLKKLGPSADRLNLTNNQLTSMVAAFTNHGGGEIDNISLSKSTTRRKRKVARREMAADVRRNFTCRPGQINFDGKLMADLYGFGKVNRLAIVLVQEDSNKILGIVKTESSTGKAEAEAVKKALDEWEITEKIIACGFDTTSSNTGVRKGACTLLQELLSRQILWLACRHHILELVVGAAFFELFGDTKSPEVTNSQSSTGRPRRR